jgi:hypothetical protein
MSTTKGWFARVGDMLAAGCADSARMISKLGPGEGLLLYVKRIRSLQWHRMYFAICREIGQNQEPARDEDSIDYELRIRAGHYEVIFVDGHEVRYPKRIAFDKLTADQWAQLWPSLDLAMQEHFGFDHTAQRYAA